MRTMYAYNWKDNNDKKTLNSGGTEVYRYANTSNGPTVRSDSPFVVILRH